ncbi:signal transduction histidine-protein kinase/phosphatase MprB [Lachnospiraceae bacterium]|nr:signal transduction histidine-protein kinase/phosphatase MprB [Lachnospiraceae bacterium]
MGKIRERKRSLKWDFVKYVLVCAFLALGGSGAIGISTSNIETEYMAVMDEGLRVFVGERKEISPAVMKNYVFIIGLVDLCQVVLIPLWSLLCVMVCGVIFYRRKLGRPIGILLTASENISQNRLDFTVEVPGRNELGLLCQSFEKMRIALRENNLEMWRQIEERKRLNAAFAHDLRTPLTVLKGQSEMLEKYAPKMSQEKVAGTARMMGRHIKRLEAYVNTMNDLQRLEDIEIKKQPVDVAGLIRQMGETGSAVCQPKELVVEDDLAGLEHMDLDASVVMQVYENLLSNAARFAKGRVKVTLGLQEGMFLITVWDDGAGFTGKDLGEAVKPFYTSGSQGEKAHLGMGLNICKILCEKHGGHLELSNGHGAKVAAAFRTGSR